MSFEDGRNQCCVGENEDGNSTGDCDSSKWPKGPAFGAILTFAEHEKIWLRDFAKAWSIAVNNGHENLVSIVQMEKRRKKKEMRKKQKKQRSKKMKSKSGATTTTTTRSKRGRGRGRGRNLLLI
jgi:hypothetical protein